MKKRILFFCIVFIIICFVGCGTNNNVPTQIEIYQQINNEDNQILSELTIGDLSEAWGEPAQVGSVYFWPITIDNQVKYITAWVNSNGITTISISTTIFITIVDIRDNVVYGIYDYENYSTDVSALIYVPTNDCLGNELNYQPGDLYIFETDGIIMATYPGQIGAPYSATFAGTLEQDMIQVLQDTIPKV